MTGKRVLYIDDDAGIRRLVGRAMERRGYHMTLAESGADGTITCPGWTGSRR
jgi:ActR/RegA family two-component response regulator